MSWIRFIAALTALLAILLIFDYLQLTKANKATEIFAVLDAFIHGVVAVVVVSPLLVSTGISKILTTMLAFWGAGILDIDHFLVARSIRVSHAIKLKLRPYTHSITFAFVMGLLVWGISQLVLLGVVAFVTITSHVIRDASDGITPFLWPLPVKKIPYWSYVMVEILLLISLHIWSYYLLAT